MNLNNRDTPVMDKTAKCSCGNLSITISGKPEIIAACNCRSCQVRTGSAFALNSYFRLEDVVEKKGSYKNFEHFSEDGRSIERAFCTECGTTVFWHAELLPGYVGIAVGCFDDPSFPEPRLALWQRSKYDWVRFPDHWIHSDNQELRSKYDPVKRVPGKNKPSEVI